MLGEPALILSRHMSKPGIIFVLQPSKIEGVGVFAARDIPSGSPLELFDDEEALFVRISDITDEEEKKAIEKYGVEDNGGYFIPKNWHKMCIGWYLNHSDIPNVHHDNGENYYALRDIKKGEELTIDYKTLDSAP